MFNQIKEFLSGQDDYDLKVFMIEDERLLKVLFPKVPLSQIKKDKSRMSRNFELFCKRKSK